MKAVVDTNVIAYFVLGAEPYADEARALLATLDDARAPAVWEAELANVLWMAARKNVLTIDEAAARLSLTKALGIHSVSNRTLWQGALVRAHQSGVAVYDTLFVELAVREHLPLATFDTGLLRSFPSVAARPAALIADA